MRRNPLLERLGFDDGDRVVVFHADDVGMCEATVDAYRDILDFGLVSSASLMTVAPWFPAAASVALERSPATDIGVHLTVTSEWRGLRWGPITFPAPEEGLTDDMGYMPDNREVLQRRAKSEAVRVELRAQIERALAAQLDITHVDSHMFALLHPRLMDVYFEVAAEFGVSALAPRTDEHEYREQYFWNHDTPSLTPGLRQAELRGLPQFDLIVQLEHMRSGDRLEEARAQLRRLPAGMTYFIMHPARDTPELRAITDHWQSRVADYQLCVDERWRRAIRESGVQVVDFRAIRDAYAP